MCALVVPNVVQQLCHLLALSTIVLLLTSCHRVYIEERQQPWQPMYDGERSPLGPFKTAFIVDQIDHLYRGSNPGPIGVTTFVNLDDLYTSSTFGRVYSEQVMSELSLRGYDVVELRHADALQFLAPSGEFALSRDVASVRRERDLGALVVGTYVSSPQRVYVNARLINPATSVVLSAGSVQLVKSNEIARMLRGSNVPPTLERIPVRHLANNSYPLWAQPNPHARGWMMEESSEPQPRIPAFEHTAPKKQK